MLNVYDLENRWLKYKLKKSLPYIIIFFSLTTMGVISVFYYQNKEETKQQLLVLNKKEDSKHTLKQKQENLTEVVEKVQETNQSVPKKVQPILTKTPPAKKTENTAEATSETPQNKEKNTKLKLSPSMNFIRTMRDDTLPYYEHEDIPESDTPTPSSKSLNQPQQNQAAGASGQDEQSEKPDIKITVKTTKKDIEDVVKRFKKNNNPALSLFIAKKYYELGEYDKSYNYALMTNEINRDIEASWIIFSKSLVKMHKKELALKTLKQYIKQSGSDKAKRLLNDIQIGKFK